MNERKLQARMTQVNFRLEHSLLSFHFVLRYFPFSLDSFVAFNPTTAVRECVTFRHIVNGLF